MKNLGRSAIILAAAGALMLTGCSTDEGKSGPSAADGDGVAGGSSYVEPDPSRAVMWHDNTTDATYSTTFRLESGILKVSDGECEADNIACIPAYITPLSSGAAVDFESARAEIVGNFVATDSEFSTVCTKSGMPNAGKHVESVQSVREIKRNRKNKSAGIEVDLVLNTMNSPSVLIEASGADAVCTPEKNPLTAALVKQN